MSMNNASWETLFLVRSPCTSLLGLSELGWIQFYRIQISDNDSEPLCVSSSVMAAVPTTTTGGALYIHSLRGAAGRRLDLPPAIDFSLDEFLIPS